MNVEVELDIYDIRAAIVAHLKAEYGVDCGVEDVTFPTEHDRWTQTALVDVSAPPSNK